MVRLLLLGTGAFAQNTLTPTLNLDQALELAEQNHPRLRVAEARRDGARAGVTTAKAYPNPEVTTLQGHQSIRLDSAVPGYAQHYSASQPLETRGVRRTRIEAAQLGSAAGGFALEVERLDVRGNVKQAFYEVLRRQGEIELTTENLRNIEDLRRRLQLQFDVGEIARLELVRAEAEAATARTLLNSARLRLVAALSVLGQAVGAPVGDGVELRGSLYSPPVLMPLEDLRAAVFARHPAVELARSEVRYFDARLASERAQRFPQPSVRTEYERWPDLQFFRAGITIPLPIWNRREGPIAEAAAALEQARAAENFRRLELGAALDRAYGQYQLASQQIVSLESGALREAAAALEAAEAAFRFGERGILEVLDAQRVLRGVRQDFLNAQYDRQAALLELETLRAVDLGGTNP